MIQFDERLAPYFSFMGLVGSTHQTRPTNLRAKTPGLPAMGQRPGWIDGKVLGPVLEAPYKSIHPRSKHRGSREA